jgi:ADP-glucose pyrophosphorylase
MVALSSVGSGATIEDGCVVEGSILLPFARVLGGAHVRNSILGESASVMGMEVSDETIEDGTSRAGD